MEENAPRQFGRERDKHFGVGVRPFRAVDDERIAAGLALAANPIRDEPHGRVEEQQRFDDSLREIHEVVPTTDVGQLVQQDHFDFVRRPAGERRGRQQNDRPQDADEHRRGDAIADGEADALADAQRSRQLLRAILRSVRRESADWRGVTVVFRRCPVASSANVIGVPISQIQGRYSANDCSDSKMTSGGEASAPSPSVSPRLSREQLTRQLGPRLDPK